MARFPVQRLRVHRLQVRRFQIRRSQAGAFAGLALLLAPLIPAPALRAEPLGASSEPAASARLPFQTAVPLAPGPLDPGSQVVMIQAPAPTGTPTGQARDLGAETLAAQPLLADAASPGPQASPEPGLGEALAPSSPAQSALGAHLRQKGFLFYGAWWCPACFRQKSLFGEQAGQRLPYVECDRNDAGRERCQAADIRAYPTWVRGQERREGVLSLEELARWSGWKPR